MSGEHIATPKASWRMQARAESLIRVFDSRENASLSVEINSFSAVEDILSGMSLLKYSVPLLSS